MVNKIKLSSLSRYGFRKINKGIVALTLFIACKSKHVETGYEITESKKRALMEKALLGNTDAYSELQTFYMLNNEVAEPYLLNLLVANKYNNKEAYFSLYWCLIYSNGGDYSREERLERLDDCTKYYCLYYLLKSHELGYYESNSHCEEIFNSDYDYPKSDVYMDSIKLCSR